MPPSATIKSLPRAFRMLEEMRAQNVEWGEDDRHAATARVRVHHYPDGHLAVFHGSNNHD